MYHLEGFDTKRLLNLANRYAPPIYYYFTTSTEACPLTHCNIAYGANMLALARFYSRKHFEVLVEKIKDYQETTLGLSYSDFPMRCLDDGILEMIFNLSIEHRRNIHSYFFHKGG
mmetsp:Transcript_25668/g.54223  ORF Transcript_25668/g.54223 Transcript_25668/m.54223 type:complete len:115 (-) Transcript_25668:95-439(-)